MGITVVPELREHPSTLRRPPSIVHRCGRQPWCLAQGLQFFCLDSDVVMWVRNGVFQSHTQTPLGILLLGVLVRGVSEWQEGLLSNS